MRRMRQKRLKLFNNLSFFKKQNAVKLVPASSTPWSRSGEEVKPCLGGALGKWGRTERRVK